MSSASAPVPSSPTCPTRTSCGFDLAYDGGCFHHVAPHRRQSYVDVVAGLLRPGGCFGLICFSPEGGSGNSDAEFYDKRSLGGGLGYGEEQSRARASRSKPWP